MVQQCVLTLGLLGCPKSTPGSGCREQQEAGLPVSNGDAVQQVAELGFWRDRLASAAKELPLPVGRPYPAEPAPPSASVPRELPMSLGGDAELILLSAF